MPPRRALAVSTILAAAALAGCGPTGDAVVLHGQHRVTLLQTADIHSRLFPYDLQIGQVDATLGLGTNGAIANVGGAARVSHVVGRERARAARVLHLDGGDCFQGAPVFNYYSGEAEVRSLAAMGTDAMVIANHEFDKGGLNAALQLSRWATFPVLAANYLVEPAETNGTPNLGRVLVPFTVFNLDGLKTAVIGMGNLSTVSSLYEQPNRLGILPLRTTEAAQFYVDLVRPLVDLVVVLTHLGLEGDVRMIETTSGIDVVLGGHNHIVLQPPEVIQDCQLVDEKGQHYIETADASPQDPSKPRTFVRRRCSPRKVLLAHSGAFAKYVGRLDLVVSDQAKDMETPSEYDPANRFEVVSHAYRLLPVNASVPEDPTVARTLEPYAQGLDALIDLELLVGYAPDGAKRTAPSGGDSPLGNLVARSMWLRQGVQTDFALTNTTGIRADMVPGAVTVEQLFNIFPFDNSIGKMQLSGVEVEDLFDFVARRSANRGCKSQAQIAGARVVLNCGECTRPVPGCTDDADCPNAGRCDKSAGRCFAQPCAESVFIGVSRGPADKAAADQAPKKCDTDADCCPDPPDPRACRGIATPKKPPEGACDKSNPEKATGRGVCWEPIDPLATYELATSTYLAQGGSGYRVLKRNTTLFDTKIQQRDAVIDFVRGGLPCGSDQQGKLRACSDDCDCVLPGETCGDPARPTSRVCQCPGGVREESSGACTTQGACAGASGECVLRACRNDLAAFHRRRCEATPYPQIAESCKKGLSACDVGGEECRFLACVDRRIGNFADGRVRMSDASQEPEQP